MRSGLVGERSRWNEQPTVNHKALDTCVRGLRNEMIDFTSELVGIASENPPGNAYPECVRAIESRLRSLELPCEVVKYRPLKSKSDDSGAAIVLTSVGTGRRTLYFSGHYDVVPVTTPGQCSPVLKGKTLFGRGAADMKSGLASMLYATVGPAAIAGSPRRPGDSGVCS